VRAHRPSSYRRSEPDPRHVVWGFSALYGPILLLLPSHSGQSALRRKSVSDLELALPNEPRALPVTRKGVWAPRKFLRLVRDFGVIDDAGSGILAKQTASCRQGATLYGRQRKQKQEAPIYTRTKAICLMPHSILESEPDCITTSRSSCDIRATAPAPCVETT